MGTYPHGLFTYADLGVPDQEIGERFYSKLFGWSFERAPMGDGLFYTSFFLDGETVCGMYPERPDQKATREQFQAPPMWQSYITVDNVDVVVDKIADLGGRVLAEPFDVFTSGRMAVLADPEGAVVALWQEIGSPGGTVFNIPGSMTWNELATRDAPAAMEFYEKLLGWKYETQTDPPTYHTIKVGERSNAGMLEMTDEWPDSIPAHWMVYFGAEDVDSAVVSVEALGGSVSVPPTDIMPGRFSVVHDDQGSIFTLMTLNEWH
ncbi:MAG: VOC family protein [Acidimicrobiia bacterium]|nr:VOC family protein [Acidimicrobiia bacterium]